MAARESKWSGVFGGGGGGGGMSGPGSSTDGSLSEFNGTSGELLRESTARIESDDLSLAGQLVKFNRGGTDASAEGSGFEVQGTSGATLSQFLFDSTLASRWKAGPNGSLSAVLTAAATQTVQNKTLDNSNSIDVPDDQLRIEDTADPTKKIRFDAGAVTAGQTRVISAIDEDLELLGRTNTQTVTNKTHQDSIFDGGSASSARKIILPKGTKTALDALTQEEGLITYATDEDRGYLSNGTAQIKIGTVDGPASVTDNQLARFDGTTGKMIQDSPIGVNDSGDMAGVRDLDITGDLLVGGNAVITGNLEVQGTETTLNTDELQVEDPTIQVNFGGTDASAEGAGIEALGTGNVALGRIEYDSSLQSKWKAGAAGAEKEILTAGDTQTVSSKTLNNTNSGAFKDDQFTLEDPSDSTKKVRFDAGGVTPGQTRVISAIDEDIELLGRTNTQIVINKDIDGGTASDARRITLPKDTFANLILLTRKEGTLLYASDLDQVFYDNGSLLLSAGSGSSGEKNYIVNSAANSTNGWAATGGTFGRTTTAANLPREFTTGSAFAFTSSTDEEYVRYRFSLDDVDLDAKLKWVIDYISSTTNFRLEMWKNSASNYGGSYTEIALEHDSSGDSYLVAASSGHYQTTFDTDTTPYLELRIVHNGTNSDTIYFSDVLVGPGTIGRVPAVGLYERVTSYTLGATVTPPTPGTATYLRETSRNGDGTATMRFEFAQTAAGASNGTGDYLLPLPAGLTIDYSRAGFVIAATNTGHVGEGTFASTTNGTRAARAFVLNNGAYVNKIAVSLDNDAATNVTWSASTGGLNTNTAVQISIVVRVPIAEWAGTVSTGPAPAEEFVSNSGTTATAGASNAVGNTVHSQSGSLFLSVASTTASNTTDFVCRFKYPIQADDEIALEVNNGNGWFPAHNVLPFSYLNTSVYGLQVLITNSTDVTVSFGNKGARTVGAATYGADGQAWSVFVGLGYRWRVRKNKKASLPYQNASSVASGLVSNESTGTASIYLKVSSGADLAGPVTIRWTRVGKLVSVLIPAISASTANTSLRLSTSPASGVNTWPAEITPARSQYGVYSSVSNTTYSAALMVISSAGVFTISSDMAGSSFTGSTVIKGVGVDINFTYMLD